MKKIGYIILGVGLCFALQYGIQNKNPFISEAKAANKGETLFSASNKTNKTDSCISYSEPDVRGGYGTDPLEFLMGKINASYADGYRIKAALRMKDGLTNVIMCKE